MADRYNRSCFRGKFLKVVDDTGGISAAKLFDALSQSDKRLTKEKFQELKTELVEASLISVGRGGGGGVVELTPTGEKRVPTGSPTFESAVKKEKDLYAPLVKILNERDIGSHAASHAFKSAFTKHGQWQNPDVTEVIVQEYPRLQTHETIVRTFEVKQWEG